MSVKAIELLPIYCSLIISECFIAGNSNPYKHLAVKNLLCKRCLLWCKRGGDTFFPADFQIKSRSLQEYQNAYSQYMLRRFADNPQTVLIVSGMIICINFNIIVTEITSMRNRLCFPHTEVNINDNYFFFHKFV